MLIGEYTHNFDDKNRVSVPSKFRKEIGKKIVVTRGLDNCLFMYTLAEWKKIAGKMGEMSMLGADMRGFNRFMLAGASEIDVDAIGRVLIPEYLRDFAKIKEKVVFAGVHNRVELWNENAWKEYKNKVVREADALAEKLGQVGAF
jgi:MraZ protein